MVVSFLWQFYKMSLKSALEYRTNFLMQTFGMMVNNSFWILFWFLFFSRFHNVNSWGFQEMVLLMAVLTLGWGLAVSLFSNFRRLSKQIQEGQLDYYLTLPFPVLIHVLMNFGYSSMGELLFSIIIAAIVLEPAQFPLFLFLGILVCFLFLGWGALINSITFFTNRFEMAAEVGQELLTLIGSFPFSIYAGATKFILLFVVPAGFVAGIPVQLIGDFSWTWLGAMVGTVAFFVGLGTAVFYMGLRRYTSGNVMAMKD